MNHLTKDENKGKLKDSIHLKLQQSKNGGRCLGFVITLRPGKCSDMIQTWKPS